MKTHSRFLFLAFLAISLLVTSCTKDDGGDVLPEPETLSFKQEDILNSLPDALLNATDPNAQTVVGWVRSATDWSSFYTTFTPPENAVRVKGSSVTYTWSYTGYEGFTVTYWWTYADDETTNYWKMEIQINNGERLPYIESFEKKNGSAGEVKYSFDWASYDTEDEPAGIYWIYKYNLNDAGDYTFSWLYESDSEEYENFLRYDVRVNANGSGTVSYQSLGELYYHAEWDAIGNGSYTFYNEGQAEYTESWNFGQ